MKSNLLFKEWYDSQDNARLDLRQRIIDSCAISRAVFYNWYGGISPIPILAQREIEKIAGRKIFEI